MYLIMSKDIADAVRGVYNTYFGLAPILLSNGLYALPSNILQDKNFAEVHGVLSQCDIVDTIEVTNEITD